jgi:hypothetical protein
MAYIDFRMQPPLGEGDVRQRYAAPVRHRSKPAAPAPKTRPAMWLGMAVVVLLIVLVFTLALASIGEPFVAGVVTMLLLLPAGSLFGGDGRRRA